MSTRKEDNQLGVEADVLSASPVGLRRVVRIGTSCRRSRISVRRKASPSRRKGNKPGGIHQRANKRLNW